MHTPTAGQTLESLGWIKHNTAHLGNVMPVAQRIRRHEGLRSPTLQVGAHTAGTVADPTYLAAVTPTPDVERVERAAKCVMMAELLVKVAIEHLVAVESTWAPPLPRTCSTCAHPVFGPTRNGQCDTCYRRVRRHRLGTDTQVTP